MNRRTLLRTTTFAAPAIILAGCGVVTSNTVNGVTTLTVNVAEATAYLSGASALVSALGGVLMLIPGLPAGVGAAMSILNTAASDIASAIPALTTAANGNPTFTFDTTSVPKFISSLTADASQLKTEAAAVVPAFGAALPAQVGQYVDGIESVAAAISELFSVATAAAAAAAPPRMAVSDALALVHIKAPR